METKSDNEDGEILFFTLYIPIAKSCMLQSCTVTDLSSFNSCLKVEMPSLYKIRNARSCNLFILLLSVLLQNIQIKGQYGN